MKARYATRTRHPWMVRVHAEMLRRGLSLTCNEALAEFGPCIGTTPPAVRMSNARRHGWFSGVREHGVIVRYTALPQTFGVSIAKKKPKPKEPTAALPKFYYIGRGFPAVSSVFDLARFI